MIGLLDIQRQTDRRTDQQGQLLRAPSGKPGVQKFWHILEGFEYDYRILLQLYTANIIQQKKVVAVILTICVIVKDSLIF